MAFVPAEAFRADLAFQTPWRAGIVLVHDCQHIQTEFVSEFIDRLLEGIATLRVPGSTESRTGPAVGEDVRLFGQHIRAVIKILHRAGAAGAGPDSGRSVSDQVDGLQLAVFGRTDLDPLQGRRPVASLVMLLFAVEEELYRRAGLLRQLGRNDAGVAGAELRAKAAPHELRDDPHLALGQIKDGGQLIADAQRPLRGGVNGQAVRLPVGYDAMRLQRRVRLNLGAILAFHRYFRRRETFLDVPTWSGPGAALDWSAHVPFLLHILGAASSTRTPGGSRSSWKHHWSIVLPCFVDREHIGKRFVFDLHQACSFRCNGRIRGRDRRNGLSRIADDGILRRQLLRLVF